MQTGLRKLFGFLTITARYGITIVASRYILTHLWTIQLMIVERQEVIPFLSGIAHWWRPFIGADSQARRHGGGGGAGPPSMIFFFACLFRDQSWMLMIIVPLYTPLWKICTTFFRTWKKKCVGVTPPPPAERLSHGWRRRRRSIEAFHLPCRQLCGHAPWGQRHFVCYIIIH